MSNIPYLEKMTENTLADVVPVNSNFEELRIAVNDNDDRLTDLKTDVGVLNTKIDSQLATFQNQLNDKVEELNNSLSALTSTVSGLLKNIIPDYSNAVNLMTLLDKTKEWTATSTGWISWDGKGVKKNNQSSFRVNGNLVCGHWYLHTNYNVEHQSLFLVAKGDIITISDNMPSSTRLYFYPCRGDV